jgi:hypothetical protein
MTIEPFKVRKGEGHACLEVARSLFGQPSDITHRNQPEMITMYWHFYEDIVEVGLSVTHYFGTDRMEVSQSMAATKLDQTLCGIHMPGSSHKKLLRLVESVRKPWEEWAEEEIMEQPMWVCLYRDAGNTPSDAMESMMHMLSFESPKDKWVRRYFGKEKK